MKSPGGTPVEDDVITRLDAGDALANALDDAGPFVAEEVRKEFVGTLGGFDLVDLCAADAAVVEANVDLAEGKSFRHFEFSKFERGVGLNEDGGFHRKGARSGIACMRLRR